VPDDAVSFTALRANVSAVAEEAIARLLSKFPHG